MSRLSIGRLFLIKATALSLVSGGLKYKEGFSQNLVKHLVESHRPSAVFDPFAGIGTAPIVAAGLGVDATGIEIMPVGQRISRSITAAANGVKKSCFEAAAEFLINRLDSAQEAPVQFRFPHVRITEYAFPEENEILIAKARQFIESITNQSLQLLLDVACMTVLESSSYTRKDGQCLRWDYRSQRNLRSRVDLGCIFNFRTALSSRLSDMSEDMADLKRDYGLVQPELLIGSSLKLLRTIPSSSFDMVITSPPYANRYDYTRTYALELAWLGFDQNKFSALRQELLSATVENKTKICWLKSLYRSSPAVLDSAISAYESQHALHDILSVLRKQIKELSNRNIIQLLEGYLLEMALVVAELGRIVSPGGVVIMINDNVQYAGVEIPVDFILADFAEKFGFVCSNIWMLPRGKGNASQQMAKYGRREIRKCVYKWVRIDE